MDQYETILARYFYDYKNDEMVLVWITSYYTSPHYEVNFEQDERFLDSRFLLCNEKELTKNIKFLLLGFLKHGFFVEV